MPSCLRQSAATWVAVIMNAACVNWAFPPVAPSGTVECLRVRRPCGEASVIHGGGFTAVDAASARRKRARAPRFFSQFAENVADAPQTGFATRSMRRILRNLANAKRTCPDRAHARFPGFPAARSPRCPDAPIAHMPGLPVSRSPSRPDARMLGGSADRPPGLPDAASGCFYNQLRFLNTR